MFNRDLYSVISKGKCDLTYLYEHLFKPGAIVKLLDYTVNFISSAGPIGGGRDGRWMLKSVAPPMLIPAMVRCPETGQPVRKLWACNTEYVECVPFPVQECWELKFGQIGVTQLDSINSTRSNGIVVSKHPVHDNQRTHIPISEVVQVQSTMVYWGTDQMGTQYSHELIRMTPMEDLPRTFTEWQARSMLPLPSERTPSAALWGILIIS